MRRERSEEAASPARPPDSLLRREDHFTLRTVGSADYVCGGARVPADRCSLWHLIVRALRVKESEVAQGTCFSALA